MHAIGFKSSAPKTQDQTSLLTGWSSWLLALMACILWIALAAGPLREGALMVVRNF